MRSLTDFNLDTLSREVASHGFPPVPARRVLRAFYDSDREANLHALPIGKTLRRWLCEHVRPRHSRVLRRHESSDGTVKLLVGFDAGGGAVEALLMPSHRPDRAAACVSSQVGCAMGCDFCASTRNGLERDLTAGEIV